MKFFQLIFEDKLNSFKENFTEIEIENKTKEYFLDVAKETLTDSFSSQNIDLVSIKNNDEFKNINEFKFTDEKMDYTFVISSIKENKVSFWCYIKTKLRSMTILNFFTDEHFSNEEELIEKTRKIAEYCIKTSQESIEKIEKIENVFEEFFTETRKRLSKSFIFSLEPLAVQVFENSFEIKKSSRLFYEKQLLGNLIVTYDGDKRFSTSNIYLELFFNKKNYETFEELLTFGQNYVVQTLIRNYGVK